MPFYFRILLYFAYNFSCSCEKDNYYIYKITNFIFNSSQKYFFFKQYMFGERTHKHTYLQSKNCRHSQAIINMNNVHVYQSYLILFFLT